MGFFWEPAALQIHAHVSDSEIISYNEEKEGDFIAAACFRTIQKVKNESAVLSIWCRWTHCVKIQRKELRVSDYLTNNKTSFSSTGTVYIKFILSFSVYYIFSIYTFLYCSHADKL